MKLLQKLPLLALDAAEPQLRWQQGEQIGDRLKLGLKAGFSLISKHNICDTAHSLVEIRVRSLRNIVSKLQLSLVSPSDLVQERQLFINLLHWFNYPEVPLQEEVLQLLNTLAAHPTGAFMLRDVGGVDFITQLSSNVDPQLRTLAETILDQLYHLHVYSPSTFPDQPASFSVQPAEEVSFKGYFQQKAPSQTDAASLPCVSGNITVRCLTFSVFPWLSLTATDRHILSSNESSLRSNNPDLVRTTCELLRDVIMQDFPAEIFLQRPCIVQNLVKLLGMSSENDSSSLALYALACLQQLCRNLKSRLRFHRDPSFCSAKHDPVSQNSSTSYPQEVRGTQRSEVSTPEELSPRPSVLGRPGMRVQGDGQDGDVVSTSSSSSSSQREFPPGLNLEPEGEDPPELRVHQWNTARFCMETLQHTLALLRTEKMKVFQKALELLSDILVLLRVVVSPHELWEECSITASELASVLHLLEIQIEREKLRVCMENLGEIMCHHGRVASSEQFDSSLIHHRMSYTGTSVFTIRLLQTLLPVEKASENLPESTVSAVLQVCLDFPFSLAFPRIHESAVAYLEQCSSENHSLYCRVSQAANTMEATCSFLKEVQAEGEKNWLELLELASQAMDGFPYHQHLPLIREFIHICSYLWKSAQASPLLQMESQKILLKLLSHPLLPVKAETYTRTLDVVKECLGIHNVSKPASSICSGVHFLFHPRVLYEIGAFGLHDQAKEVNLAAKDLLLYLLKGRLMMTASSWCRFNEALYPVIPVLQSHAGVEDALGNSVLLVSGLSDETGDAGRSSPIRLRTLIRLLFNKHHAVRNTAAQHLLPHLERSENKRTSQPAKDSSALAELPSLYDTDKCLDLRLDDSKKSYLKVECVNKLYSIFTSETVDTVLRRSAAEQLVVVLQDTAVHAVLKQQGLAEKLVSLITESVNSQGGPVERLSEPSVAMLRKLVYADPSLRHTLAQRTDFLLILLRASLLMKVHQRDVTEAAALMCFLLFDEIATVDVGGEKADTDTAFTPFSLPVCVIRQFHADLVMTDAQVVSVRVSDAEAGLQECITAIRSAVKPACPEDEMLLADVISFLNTFFLQHQAGSDDQELKWLLELLLKQLLSGPLASEFAVGLLQCLRVSDAPRFYGLPCLERSLRSMTHSTALPGWSTHTSSLEPHTLCRRYLSSLLEVISSFYVEWGGNAMSFMGKGVTKNAVIALLHLSHEMMTEIKEKSADDPCSAQLGLAWLIPLWVDRDPEAAFLLQNLLVMPMPANSAEAKRSFWQVGELREAGNKAGVLDTNIKWSGFKQISPCVHDEGSGVALVGLPALQALLYHCHFFDHVGNMSALLHTWTDVFMLLASLLRRNYAACVPHVRATLGKRWQHLSDTICACMEQRSMDSSLYTVSAQFLCVLFSEEAKTRGTKEEKSAHLTAALNSESGEKLCELLLERYDKTQFPDPLKKVTAEVLMSLLACSSSAQTFACKGWMNRQTDKQDNWTGGRGITGGGRGGRIDRWTGGRINRWTGGQIDRWTGRTNRLVDGHHGTNRPGTMEGGRTNRLENNVKELRMLLEILRNCLYQHKECKEVATDLKLSSVVSSLWPWLLLNDTGLTAALDLLCVYTANCTAACSAVCASSSHAALPRNPVTTTLMHAVMKLASQVPPDNNSIQTLSFSLLANLALSRDCRGLLQKSNFLQHFLSLPMPRAGTKSGTTAVVLSQWLQLLLNISFEEDGQQMIMKMRGALETLTDLAQGKHGDNKHKALLILHNICFCSANKPRVLACDKTVELFVSCLESSSLNVCALGASALWALLHNYQKAKVILKCPSIKLKVDGAYTLAKKVSEQLKLSGSTVKLQDGMLLDCLCPWSGKLIMVSWTKDGHSSPLAIYHPEYGVNFDASYDGRVTFSNASKMDGSIKIRNVTEKDQGVYYCSLQTFPQGTWTKDILVQKQVTLPIVSYNPNTKFLHASENEDVIIGCSHNETVYEVSVEKMDGANRGISLLAVCKQNGDGVELSDYQHRGVINCSDALEMELRLPNVSQADHGSYRCNFSTDAELSSAVIHLTVVSRPKGFSADQFRWYIYIGAGVAGALFLMSVALIVTWKNRRKVKRLEYRRAPVHTTKRSHVYTNEQAGVYDRMKKTTRNQRNANPIYVNFQNRTALKKEKR
ncbi:Rotatin [Bagarius yarrelli]|uniref:Rotatin n=1 Tax=Bagarius yarrelli TaxID=175774 RepID=A0A556TWB1_BAGYA|nr:Rotatin [Bagarius yarrelli]